MTTPIARKKLGEERQAQWERMLGHRKASTSDIYALMEMGNMGHALAATAKPLMNRRRPKSRGRPCAARPRRQWNPQARKRGQSIRISRRYQHERTTHFHH